MAASTMRRTLTCTLAFGVTVTLRCVSPACFIARRVVGHARLDWFARQELTSSGGMVIHGRSDATLNPGGVRIGTAELYRVLETMPEVSWCAVRLLSLVYIWLFTHDGFPSFPLPSRSRLPLPAFAVLSLPTQSSSASGMGLLETSQSYCL